MGKGMWLLSAWCKKMAPNGRQIKKGAGVLLGALLCVGLTGGAWAAGKPANKSAPAKSSAPAKAGAPAKSGGPAGKGSGAAGKAGGPAGKAGGGQPAFSAGPNGQRMGGPGEQPARRTLAGRGGFGQQGGFGSPAAPGAPGQIGGRGPGAPGQIAGRGPGGPGQPGGPGLAGPGGRGPGGPGGPGGRGPGGPGGPGYHGARGFDWRGRHFGPGDPSFATFEVGGGVVLGGLIIGGGVLWLSDYMTEEYVPVGGAPVVSGLVVAPAYDPLGNALPRRGSGTAVKSAFGNLFRPFTGVSKPEPPVSPIHVIDGGRLPEIDNNSPCTEVFYIPKDWRPPQGSQYAAIVEGRAYPGFLDKESIEAVRELPVPKDKDDHPSCLLSRVVFDGRYLGILVAEKTAEVDKLTRETEETGVMYYTVPWDYLDDVAKVDPNLSDEDNMHNRTVTQPYIDLLRATGKGIKAGERGWLVVNMPAWVKGMEKESRSPRALTAPAATGAPSSVPAPQPSPAQQPPM